MAKNHRPVSLFALQLDHWLHQSGSKPRPPENDIVRVMLGGKRLTTKRADEVFGKTEEVPSDLLSAFESEVPQ